MSTKGRKSVATSTRAKPLPVWKKALFAVVVCALVFLAVEGLLVLMGVRPVSYDRDPYVGFSAQLPLFVQEESGTGEAMMVTAKNKERIFNVQRFSAKKSKNAFRIFCIGGSTTYGHPYTDSTSFCGWLRAMLPKADPSRKWELINCGGVSYASYREALLMEELIQYEPDLFIILSGHNEFLEQRTYGELIRMPEAVRGADVLLSGTRTYTVLKTGMDALRKKPSSASVSSNLLSAEVDTILDRTTGPQAYHRDDALRKSIVEHFRFNMARMVDIARSAGADVMLVTPALNLRHCSPFKGEHRPGIAVGEISEWQKRVREGAERAQAGDWPRAAAVLEQAIRIDDRHANGHFLLASALWELKRFREARGAFIRALEEDVCPLRALPEIIRVAEEVAAERKVPLVDFVKLIESKSPQRVPGDEWFLDHVHPTIEGHRILALALIDKMTELGSVRPSASWNEATREEIKRTVESSITKKEHGTALCTLAKVIAWAGKGGEAYRIALRARELAPEDPAVQFEVGKNAAHVGKKDEALIALKEALSLRPNFVEAKLLTGTLLMDAGQPDEALRHAGEAVALRPTDPELHLNLGSLLSRAKRPEDAAASFREALRLEPNYAEAHNNLAWILKDEGKYSEALKHFQEAVRLRPGSPNAMLGAAWLLATHPDERLRNTREAVRLGERLATISSYQSWMALDTLAAAYAAAGRFSEAVQTQEKALGFVRKASPAEAGAVQARLEAYRQQRPFVEGRAL